MVRKRVREGCARMRDAIILVTLKNDFVRCVQCWWFGCVGFMVVVRVCNVRCAEEFR